MSLPDFWWPSVVTSPGAVYWNPRDKESLLCRRDSMAIDGHAPRRQIETLTAASTGRWIREKSWEKLRSQIKSNINSQKLYNNIHSSLHILGTLWMIWCLESQIKEIYASLFGGVPPKKKSHPGHQPNIRSAETRFAVFSPGCAFTMGFIIWLWTISLLWFLWHLPKNAWEELLESLHPSSNVYSLG